MVARRSSPPTDRVVAVLDHFVAHPDAGVGLSELARALDISKPTCLGILTALTGSGYLIRADESATYRLGPALIAAGRASQRTFPGAAAARRHLDGVSSQFRTTCTASAVVGDKIVLLERIDPPGRASEQEGQARIGQLYPFAPPVGLMYVLWDSPDALERWLEREPTLPTQLDRGHLDGVVAHCRRTGYLVESLTAAGRRLHTLMAGVAAYDLPDEVRELVGEMVSSLGERVYVGTDVAAADSHPVNLIAAPTYDASGRQELVITMYVGTTLTGADITTRAAALVAAAAAITADTSS